LFYKNEMKGERTMKEKLLEMLETADNLYAASFDENISEGAQDAAYSDYHSTIKQVAAAIETLTNGQIEGLTAQRMAHFKRNEIVSLIRRMA